MRKSMKTALGMVLKPMAQTYLRQTTTDVLKQWVWDNFHWLSEHSVLFLQVPDHRDLLSLQPTRGHRDQKMR